MDAESGYFKNRDIIFPKLKIPGRELVKRFLKGVMKRLKVKSFAYNNVLFDLDDPQEEDMCIAGMLDRQSFYWAFVFPKTATYSFDELVQYKRSSMGQKWKENYLYHLKRLQYFNKDKRLVLKNPPNTARLKHILDLFPNARIIYIYRNPSDVIYSVRRLWAKGLTAFSLQSFDESMIEDKIFAYYKKFHDAYRTERNLIPPDHLVEIRYEELETDPLSVIKEIYHHFNWNMEGSIARIQDKINEEKKYMKFSYRKDEVLDRRIVQELKEYFEEEEVACFNNSIQ